MDFISQYLRWIIAGAIIVLTLMFGLPDLARLLTGGRRRVWAIASVCFAESIRRRVLWITPLAILGFIVVSQLQKPIDEQDAILQTIKICLFATGLVVTTVIIILACTNIPREIENRVIFTVLTKPATRLELVLGKIVGFAMVSGVILLIMGISTAVYVNIRAWNLQGLIKTRLESNVQMSETMRNTLETYARPGGLLTARVYEPSVQHAVYARLPVKGDPRRWFRGTADQDVIVPFKITEDDIGPEGIYIRAFIHHEMTELTDEERYEYGVPDAPETPQEDDEKIDVPAEQGPKMLSALQIEAPAPAQQAPATAPATQQAPAVPVLTPETPIIGFEILYPELSRMFASEQLNNAKPMILPTDGNTPIDILIPREVALHLVDLEIFWLRLMGGTLAMEYGIDPTTNQDRAPIYLMVPGAPGEAPKGYMLPVSNQQTGEVIEPIFRGRSGNLGEQVRGGPGKWVPVARFPFENVSIAPNAKGEYEFEMRVGVERSSREINPEDEATVATIFLRNPATEEIFEIKNIQLESRRRALFTIPADKLDGARDFEIYIKGLTAGHYIEITPESLQLITNNQPFVWNLTKSLSILWMMTILVIIVSILCSTFLSWPIAVVLTLVILLLRWAVNRLADTVGSGIGRAVVSDMFPTADASTSKALSETVDALTTTLRSVAALLPDISLFSATAGIEFGHAITASSLTGPLWTILGYGISMILAAYLIMKGKEVAP